MEEAYGVMRPAWRNLAARNLVVYNRQGGHVFAQRVYYVSWDWTAYIYPFRHIFAAC